MSNPTIRTTIILDVDVSLALKSLALKSIPRKTLQEVIVNAIHVHLGLREPAPATAPAPKTAPETAPETAPDAETAPAPTPNQNLNPKDNQALQETLYRKMENSTNCGLAINHACLRDSNQVTLKRVARLAVGVDISASRKSLSSTCDDPKFWQDAATQARESLDLIRTFINIPDPEPYPADIGDTKSSSIGPDSKLSYYSNRVDHLKNAIPEAQAWYSPEYLESLQAHLELAEKALERAQR